MGNHEDYPYRRPDPESGDAGRGESGIRPVPGLGNHEDCPYHRPDPHSGDHEDHPDRTGEPCVRPESGVRPHPQGTLPGTLGRIIQAYKSITTVAYIDGVKRLGWPPFPGKLWQRNYYEHIIRDEDELNRVREYIITNPIRWELDRENPNFHQTTAGRDRP